MSIRVKLKSQMPNTKQITRLYKKILAASRSSKTSDGGSKTTTNNRNMINWNLPEWAIIKFPPRPNYIFTSFDSPFISEWINCLIFGRLFYYYYHDRSAFSRHALFPIPTFRCVEPRTKWWAAVAPHTIYIDSTKMVLISLAWWQYCLL